MSRVQEPETRGLAHYDVSSEFTVSDQAIMSGAKNYFRWQYDLIEPFLGKRIIELGCGIGNFTELMKDRPAEILGLDIDANCVREHRQRFAGLTHIEARQLDALSDEIHDVKAFKGDTVVCLNVLEHIPDDCGVLRSMWDILEPGGKVCLIVPAFEALRGPIDELLGHYRRYTLPGFRDLAQRANFRVMHARYMNVIGFAGWWVNAKVLQRRAQSKRQVAIFDRVIVPVLSRVERVVPPPFGQNVLAILQKPERTA